MSELQIEFWLLMIPLSMFVVGGMLIFATSHGRTMRKMAKLDAEFLNVKPYNVPGEEK